MQEKKGIQKVTVNGKFVGWFLFTSGGNNVQNYWSKDRYFLPDGRMASGVTKVGKYYYFFERSSTTGIIVETDIREPGSNIIINIIMQQATASLHPMDGETLKAVDIISRTVQQ